MRDRAQAGWHANAQVDHWAVEALQFEQRAALDDLSRIQRQVRRRRAVGARTRRTARRRAGVLGVEVLAKGHPVVLRVVGDHQVVDQDAWHTDPVRIERSGWHDALDLGDHQTARVVRGLGQRQHVVVKRLLLGAEVAALVGGGRAYQRDLYRQRGIEKLQLAT